MALSGLHPVVALYATFLNRAFDQVLLDAALHQAPITFVLDRAGVTGDDGASHNGMWDLSILQVVPGLAVAAPRDEATLRALLREAVATTTGPTVVRFPKGALPPAVPAIGQRAGLDVLAEFGSTPDVLLVAVGSMAGTVVAAAERLHAQGIGVRVVDPGWVSPVPDGLVSLATDAEIVAVVEDNGRVAGVGARVALALSDAAVDRPVRVFGVPQEFLAHAPRATVLADAGLTPAAIAAQLVGLVARRTDPAALHDRAPSAVDSA
jgi:1-deoxy-D-xylulose-5-phosphate synthase